MDTDDLSVPGVEEKRRQQTREAAVNAVARSEDVDQRWAGVVGFQRACGSSLFDDGKAAMSTDSLHSLVTAAIWRAEQLEEHGVSSSPLAWAEVSSLEEELAGARSTPPPTGASS